MSDFYFFLCLFVLLVRLFVFVSLCLVTLKEQQIYRKNFKNQLENAKIINK